MNNLIISIIIILFFFPAPLMAQDTIWFLSGELLITSKYEIKTEEGILVYYNKKNKEKTTGLEYVFSIVDSKGNERVIFEPVKMDNVPFSVEQMRSFIKGEYLASTEYHAPLATIIGIAAGFGGFIAAPAVGMNYFYAPLLPATYIGVLGMTNPSEERILKRYPQYANDDYFIAGYEERSQEKRITNAVWGSLVGIAAGIVTVVVLSLTN
jgi:hypothetical protein